MGFAQNLKQLRGKRQFSQEELAHRLQVSRQSVSKWEQGSTYPEVETLLLLAKELDVSLDTLMNEEEALPASLEGSPYLRIASYDGRALVRCTKFITSPRLKARHKKHVYVLFGVNESNTKEKEQRTILGWYEHEEALKKELKEIEDALTRGEDCYKLQYASNIIWHWWGIDIT